MSRLIGEPIKVHLNKDDLVGAFIWRKQHVINVKYKEWNGTEYSRFLVPETLFRASKFEKYLNQPAHSTPEEKRKKEDQDLNKKRAAFFEKSFAEGYDYDEDISEFLAVG